MVTPGWCFLALELDPPPSSSPGTYGASTTLSLPVNLSALWRTFFEIWSSRFIDVSFASSPAPAPLSLVVAIRPVAVEAVDEWIRLEIVLHAIWIERWRDSMSRSSG